MSIPLTRYRDLLLTYLRPQGGKVLLLALVLLSSVGLQLFNPQLLRIFIDAAGAASPLATLIGIAALYLGAAAFGYLLNIAQAYLSEDVGWTATNALRADLATHLLHLDLAFHNEHAPGELIERVDGDVSSLFSVLSSQLFRVLSHALLLPGILLLLFLIDWRLGIVLTLYALIALFILSRLRNFATSRLEVAHQARAELAGFLMESLGATEDIRSSSGTEYIMRNLYRLMRTAWQKNMAGALKMTLLQNITMLMFALSTTLSLGIGAYLFLNHRITPGTLYLLFQYTQTLMQPLQGITQEVHSLQDAGACIQRIDKLYQLQSTHSLHTSNTLPSGALSMSVEHLTFGYQPDHPVLNDLSFHLEAGKVLGLLGRTGSGKTTIARLLLRLYTPTDGTIRIDSQDIRHIAPSELRKKIALATQDVQIFHASVRDNLTLFDRSIPDSLIVQWLYEVELGKWYERLADGLETELDSGGTGLSAGEAQLLALVRIFLKDPGLVILDEATSRLDPVTEQRIFRAVTRLLQGRTGIIIAHRLAMINCADEIIILEGGQIREQGTRMQLAHDPYSVFAHLLNSGSGEVLA